MTIENTSQDETSVKRLNILSARWSSPWIVMLLVCAAGAGDGALRAVCILTIGSLLGEIAVPLMLANPFYFAFSIVL